MKHRHSIYVITNLINEKQYVGETSKTIKERFAEHWRIAKNSYRGYPLYLDMKKFGIENFKIETLEEFESDDRNLEILKEERWISKLNTYKNGYNNAPKQYVTSTGYKFSEERKQEYSQMFQGENNPMYEKNVKDFMTDEGIEEWKEKLSKARLGKKITEQHKENMSKNSKRKKKVLKFNLNNEIVNEYESLTIASNENSIPISSLSYAIKNKKQINNYYYAYKQK